MKSAATRFFGTVLLLMIGGCAGSSSTAIEPPPPPAPSSPVATNAPTSMRPPGALSEEKQAVKHVLDRFGRMWEDESMETFAEIIAHDPNIVVIGTDTAEYLVGYAAFHDAREAQFESFDNVEFHVDNQRIRLSDSGNTAWFTEEFDLFTIAEGTPVSLSNLRLSGVLERRDGQWVIVQLHTSVPVAGQAVEY